MPEPKPKLPTYTILRADETNRNNRIYPREVLEKALRDHPFAMSEIFGQIGYPKGTSIPLSDISHRARNIRLEGKELKTDIEILPTPPGIALQKLIDKVPNEVTFRPTGNAQVHINPDGTYLILDYNIISINAIYDGEGYTQGPKPEPAIHNRP